MSAILSGPCFLPNIYSIYIERNPASAFIRFPFIPRQGLRPESAVIMPFRSCLRTRIIVRGGGSFHRFLFRNRLQPCALRGESRPDGLANPKGIPPAVLG